MLERDTILNALQATLEPLPFVHAMWQAGAASFDRVDRWSDIDLQVIATDGRARDVAEILEGVLTELSPVEIKYEIPQPSWHGHYQAFYRLRDAGPFLLIDFVAMELDSPNKFLQSAIHGTPIVVFDKSGAVAPEPFDDGAFLAGLRDRVAAMECTFPLFQAMTLKEVARGNRIEALQFYQGHTLRPLVEALGITHRPARYNFHTRYVYYDFPPEIVARLEDLFFVANVEDLVAKHEAAGRWFAEAIAVNWDDVAARLREAR